MRTLRISMAVGLLFGSATAGFAGPCDTTCTVSRSTGEVAYPCDYTCPGGSCLPTTAADVCPYTCKKLDGTSNGHVCNPPGHADCAGQGDFVNCTAGGDSIITICGTAGADSIQAIHSGNAVCGFDGDDYILQQTGTVMYANGGADDDTLIGSSGVDRLMGGSGSDYIYGAGGSDALYGLTMTTSGSDGDNFLEGSTGDDLLIGAAGSDTINGGDGADSIAGQGGRDVLRGDDGDDLVILNYGGSVVNDVLGALLCGGAGDDTLYANGPGHQCMDAGEGQVVVGAEKDCTYANTPDDTDMSDVATARNCLAPVKISTNGVLRVDTPWCGCE